MLLSINCKRILRSFPIHGGNWNEMRDGRGITVWTVALHTIPALLWPQLAGLLNRSERKRAARFSFERHRRQHVAAHALKRIALSTLASSDVAPRCWDFKIASSGKPEVSQPAGPYFNLSHCEGLVACAVSHDVELGVDVECLTRNPPFEIVQRHFSPDERAWLSSLSAEDRRIGFFRLWTLKEALIKALGLGLAQPLDGIAFACDPPRLTSHNLTFGDPATWCFRQYSVGTEHMLALAWRDGSPDISVVMRAVTFDEILSPAKSPIAPEA